MIIDLILERKNGIRYNPKDFYNYCMGYMDGIGDDITRAMDYGTETDVKKALCDYIIEQEYNPEICLYVCSVNWLEA